MATPKRVRSTGLLPLYAAEAVNSIAGTLLTVGLPFYTTHRFGWGAKENFATAALQGVCYVLGALLARRISGRWGREKSLVVLCSVMTTLAVAVGFSASSSWAFVTALLVVVETGVMAASWPMLESLVSAAGPASALSKRLGWYNIVWATTGAAAVAASGAIIQHAPAWGFFGITATTHALAGIFLFSRFRTAGAVSTCSPADPEPSHSTELDAHRQRLALWLSRIALPSTYVIVYSLAPALPSLHAINQLSPTVATLVASIWLVARAAAFAITGSTTFWHRRPGLMLLASVTMLFAFVGTILSGASSHMGLSQALLGMAAAQIVLGLSIGTIYAASLYFGMAVSEGSTEHGGYHEALIGLGQILGPMVGASMQLIYPSALWPAVMGISGVVCVTVLVEAFVGLRLTREAGLNNKTRAEAVTGAAK